MTFTSVRSQMNHWRDAQSSAAKGCGCGVLVGVGVIACGSMMGAVMGDYIGPAVGASDDIHQKNVTILLSVGTLALCYFVGRWLVWKHPR